MELLNIDELQDPNTRYVLGDCIGTGLYGKVYRATDKEEGKRAVAIKVVTLSQDNVGFLQEEYRVLKTFSDHPNLPDLYNVYKSSENGVEEIWFVMQICEGGPVTNLTNGLQFRNRRISEEHIAFILKEVVKALLYLHENGVMHRDVKGSNILLTKHGDVKLVDFGLSRCLDSNLSKAMTFIGSPSWIAPEVITSLSEADFSGYDNRADVWSLGITALELANGRAPYEDMHPTRALFQIVRNPPPALGFLNNWSEDFIDFINECLVKIPEHRPYIVELLEHPFLTQIPDNSYHFTQELMVLNQQFSQFAKDQPHSDYIVQSTLLKCERDAPLEKMQVEDLAALSKLNEDVILKELADRTALGQFYTFIGDVLLVLNTSEQEDVFGYEEHHRYQLKSRSDNAPHIYAVADAAYQAALHHKTVQHIVLSGESASGKTKNYLHLIEHLLYLGRNDNINQERIKDAIKIIHAFTHASTPTNDYSTRCILRTEITFGETGKNTGAVFEICQIDKWRISSTDMNQANYHILYYFYDGVHEIGQLDKYRLTNDRSYRYLRISKPSKSNQPRDTPKQNVKKFEKIQEMLHEFQFSEEQIEAIFTTLAAIINLGDVRFIDGDDTVCEIQNGESVERVATLLQVDQKKLAWSLINYCCEEGKEIRPVRHTCHQARDARDSLANALYCRIVQYVVWVINQKLSMGRTLFGEKHSIKVLDTYGFECFKRNELPQFLINCFNEELQYHYLQKVFGWEAMELTEENVPFTSLRYYNNRDALEEMLGKSSVLALIDEASKLGKPAGYITDRLQITPRVCVGKINGSEFCVNHYTGKVTYDSKEMPECNREYLSPEIVQTMLSSSSNIIKSIFECRIDKCGNICFSDVGDGNKIVPHSQTKKMRTSSACFKALSLKLLNELSVGGGTGGSHFVRCIRSDLQNSPKGFCKPIIKQQLRAMSVLETAEARQFGFPYRISFSEFLRRYKYLAFDFNENVEVTKENCRLLLIRLKMEGWAIGKSKVLLKYYNEEYLSRSYETHVKKVIKIQAMIRSYLIKRRFAKKIKAAQQLPSSESSDLTQDEAATVIQKSYRGYIQRKEHPKLNDNPDICDDNVTNFIRGFYTRWRAKTIFQVILQYRAARYVDLYNFSQQVHLYNQNVVNVLQKHVVVDLSGIETRASVDMWLGVRKQPVLKIPFRLNDVPYFDTSRMCESSVTSEMDGGEDDWDAPLHWKENITTHITAPPICAYSPCTFTRYQSEVLAVPYTRSPTQHIRSTPSPVTCYNNDKDDEIRNAYRNVTPVQTSPANNDFEYISIPKQQPTRKSKGSTPNPIVELEMKGIRNSVDSEDDPPYNFQAMLRKTNFRKDYVSREQVILEKPVLKVSSVNNIKEPKVVKNYENICLRDNSNAYSKQPVQENNKLWQENNKEEQSCVKQNHIVSGSTGLKENPKVNACEKEENCAHQNQTISISTISDIKKKHMVTISENCEIVTTNEVDAGVYLEGFEISV